MVKMSRSIERHVRLREVGQGWTNSQQETLHTISGRRQAGLLTSPHTVISESVRGIKRGGPKPSLGPHFPAPW